jgi:hypothetical protein
MELQISFNYLACRYELNLPQDYCLKGIERQYWYQFYLNQNKLLIYPPYQADPILNNSLRLSEVEFMEYT